MIVPDKEDANLYTRIGYDFGYRFQHLQEHYSPILPLHFDKKFLPSRFEQCREQRDLRILEGVRQWEEGHIERLDAKNRQMYLQGLTFKLDRLKEEYEKIPSNSSKQTKLTHVQAEIEQIKWRMKNIRNFISNQNQQKGQ